MQFNSDLFVVETVFEDFDLIVQVEPVPNDPLVHLVHISRKNGGVSIAVSRGRESDNLFLWETTSGSHSIKPGPQLDRPGGSGYCEGHVISRQ